MTKNISLLKPALQWMSTLAIIFSSSLSYAQDPVSVTALAVHYAGNIQYSYQVSNHTRARRIESVSIGNRGVQPPDSVNPVNAQPELSIYPTGSYWKRMPDQGDSRNVTLRLGGIFSSPPGWTGGILDYEETSYFSVDWNLDDSNTKTYPLILPGQTFNFGVTVPLNDDPRSPYSMSDPAYLAGHFTVGFDVGDTTDEGPLNWNYTGSIVPLDTIPPTLEVTLSPNIIRSNEKLVPITATITVKDNYDPAPEIKLESITANEVLEAKDIQDAKFFIDDRSFKLRAERKEGSHAGRIYTVTYSATDASGNKAIATATVTVPREEKGHEDRRDDKVKNDKDDHKRDR